MRFWIRRVRVFSLSRMSSRGAASAILAGVLMFAGSSAALADGANPACELTPPDAQTLIDCCCTNDGCSTESCDTNTCSNETCSRDSCTTNTCSTDNCSSDSCTSDTCKSDTCKSERCSSDNCKTENCSSENCKTDTCSTDTCRASNCGYDTCKTDTCSSDTCKSDNCSRDNCSSDSCDNDTCGSETCSRDTCTSNRCSTETCSRDSCSRDTCSTATCSVDSCDTQNCGTDGCNFQKVGNEVVREFNGTPGDQCNLSTFGSPVPTTGIAHLDVLDGRRSLVQGNQLALTNGQRQSVSYKMVYRADASRDSQYQWRLGARSSTALEITGTTGVGPVRGIIQDRTPAQLQIKAPRSLIGRREWLRFDVLKDGAVVHETYLFLNVR